MTTPTEQKIPRSRLDIARDKALKAVALLQELEIKAEKAAAKNRRELDNRRKILLGAYLMHCSKVADIELSTMSLMGVKLSDYLTRENDRVLFGLPPLPPVD